MPSWRISPRAVLPCWISQPERHTDGLVSVRLPVDVWIVHSRFDWRSAAAIGPSWPCSLNRFLSTFSMRYSLPANENSQLSRRPPAREVIGPSSVDSSYSRRKVPRRRARNMPPIRPALPCPPHENGGGQVVRVARAVGLLLGVAADGAFGDPRR